MAEIASDHIKPCNVGQSEAHNRRSREYLASLPSDRLYIRTDLTRENEEWSAPEVEDGLPGYLARLAEMVKQKTGRAMQTKDRQRVNKKTGRVTTVRGSTPIREGVVLCKADTTMDDLKRYGQMCHDRFGITPIQIFIHRDEGYCADPGNKASWQPNYHAHIVWDWMDHGTGKSHKLDKDDMSAMQGLAAEALGMQRGKSKGQTGAEHMERNDYILAKQRRESEALDREIEEKKERSRKSTNEAAESVKLGLANIFGKGKYAEIERRNKELEEAVPKEREQLRQQFGKAVENEAEKRTAVWKQRLAEANAEKQAIKSHRDSLSEKSNRLEEENERLRSEVKWQSLVLIGIGKALYHTQEWFSHVINSIINFGQMTYGGRKGGKGHKDFLEPEEAAGIKVVMDGMASNEYGRKSVGKWMTAIATIIGKLTDSETYHASRAVEDVAAGGYDHLIGRQQDGGIRR